MNGNRFSRYPGTTIFAVLLAVFLLLDLTLGYFFCPKVVGTPDAYYHHDLPRNVSGIKRWGSREYRVFTNSLGFIDREVREIPKAVDHRRILFLGDSFTEGVGHEFDETFVGLFSRRVAGDGVEVLNAAVTSYSPKLYYLKTRYLLRNVGLRFDELVVCIDISDIQDEIAHEEFVPAGDFGVSRFFLFNRIDSLLKQSSLTYHMLRPFLKREPVAVSGLPGGAGVDELLPNWEKDRDGWTVDESLYRAWGERGLALAGEHMRLLAELCAEHKVRLTVVVYPWPRQIVAGDLDSRQVRYWKDFCRRYDLGFIDLFPVFIGGQNAGQVLTRFFISGDVHWNGAGHQLVAERIYREWSSRSTQ